MGNYLLIGFAMGIMGALLLRAGDNAICFIMDIRDKKRIAKNMKRRAQMNQAKRWDNF